MTVGPRTRVALQAIGCTVQEAAGEGMRRIDLRLPYVGGFRSRTFHEGNEAAEGEEWSEIMEFVRANAEALCSRMMAAIVAHPDNYVFGEGHRATFTFGAGFTDEKAPHDTVLAIFLRVCCDPEDVDQTCDNCLGNCNRNPCFP